MMNPSSCAGARLSFDSRALAHKVTADELAIMLELELFDRLRCHVRSEGRLAAFAEAFYFVRYDFYRLNFIVGARSAPHERYWTGLVQSLYEETGGDGGKSHNQLYRDFLRCAGARSESDLAQPAFARDYNESWETYCRNAPFAEALCGLAIFEILDRPDYSMLLNALRDIGLPGEGLMFFEVHAAAEHFEFFESTLGSIGVSASGRLAVESASAFVCENQRRMWRGLLEHLEYYS